MNESPSIRAFNRSPHGYSYRVWEKSASGGWIDAVVVAAVVVAVVVVLL